MPRRAGRGWRVAVSSGAWSPGCPGRGALEVEVGAALSGWEAEVEACLCEWMKPAADEEALATRGDTQRLQEVQDFPR